MDGYRFSWNDIPILTSQYNVIAKRFLSKKCTMMIKASESEEEAVINGASPLRSGRIQHSKGLCHLGSPWASHDFWEAVLFQMTRAARPVSLFSRDKGRWI